MVLLPTQINPTDIATRIVNPVEPVNYSLWCNGPNFLITQRLEIPNQDHFTTIEDAKKQNDVMNVTVLEEKTGRDIDEVIDCSKFGLLEKLLQVTCFFRRFVLNLKAKQMRSQRL